MVAAESTSITLTWLLRKGVSSLTLRLEDGCGRREFDIGLIWTKHANLSG